MKKLNNNDLITVKHSGIFYLKNYNDESFKSNLKTFYPDSFGGYLDYLNAFKHHYVAITGSFKVFDLKLKELDGKKFKIQSTFEYVSKGVTSYYYMVQGFDKPLMSEFIHEAYENKDELIEVLNSGANDFGFSVESDSKLNNIKLPKTKFKPIKAQDSLGKTIIGYSFGNDNILKLDDNGKFIKTLAYGFKRSLTNDEIVKYLSRAKIKNYEDSSKIFGYKNPKKEMYESNLLFKIKKITEGYESVKAGTKIDIAEIDNGVKTLKFLLSDIEIVVLEPKGFNEPTKFKITNLEQKKDILNRNVILIRDKNLPIKKASKGILLDIWTEGSAVKGTYKKGNLRDANYDKNSKVRVKFENKEIICRFKNIKLIK